MPSVPTRRWKRGDYLTHRSNPELGIGRIREVDARTVLVDFPHAGASLRLAAATEALRPVELNRGRRVRVTGTGAETTIDARLENGLFQLATGDVLAPDAFWPVDVEGALVERLALDDMDDAADFRLRMDMLRLLALREAGGLGSFLGGRIRLFPHQLYVAERATATEPVRWLLADEVGLGKTIEAALVITRLVHTGRVERCLIAVPDALTVQWLGELWRKYHQVFTLLDAARLGDVERDFGAGFNPFDVHRRAVIALEMLVERPHLTAQAVQAGIDLLVVDEAQRLRRPPGHPGEPAYRAVAPIAALGRHVLLLSATPLEDDAHGFFRLLQLLRPDEFPDEVGFEQRLADRRPLPPCISSTRRADIGGLPPRVGIAVPLEPASWDLQRQLEDAIRSAPADNAVARRVKLDRIRRAAASGAALAAVLRPDEPDLRRQAADMDRRGDPRIAWLLAQGRRWRDAREKTLIFVAHRETLEMLRAALSERGQLASGVFHEELSPARRDTEVARFREPAGPSILVSTECGGEGRNFEFCHRLVLFDLPWRPSTVEQRIGRLDRIGRRIPVEILYFTPPTGIGRDGARLYEALGVFREPLAGLEPQLTHIEGAIEALASETGAVLTGDLLARLLADAQAARSRIHEAAYQQLHRDPYRAEMAHAILARVPADLDSRNERVMVAACERLGFSVERSRGRRAYSVEIGSSALVDALPGVPGGSTFVGTLDREEAVQRETIDFFASGHPLLEGLFAYFDDSGPGRASGFRVSIGGQRGEGLAAVYKRPVGFDIVAFDSSGRLRPDWASALSGPEAVLHPLTAMERRRLAATAERLAPLLDPTRRPHAVAAVLVRPYMESN